MSITMLQLSGASRKNLSACKSALNSIDGVSAEIDYKKCTAKIKYDESKVEMHDILSVISKNGFGAVGNAAKNSRSNMKAKHKRIHTVSPGISQEITPKGIAVVVLSSLALLMMRVVHYWQIQIFGIGIKPQIDAIIAILLCIPCVICSGAVFRNGMSSLAALKPDRWSVAALAASASIIYSAYSCLLVAIGLNDSIGNICLDTCGVILSLVMLFSYIDSKLRRQTGEPIKQLMDLFPKMSTVIINDAEIETKTEDISVGDLLLIKPGEKFPCDGVIEAGRASVDESMFTGENIPVDKAVGDRVYAGCINTVGFITVCAEKVGEDTSLARMIKSVETIANAKTNVAQRENRIEGIFCSSVIILSIAAFLIWLAVSGSIDTAFRVLCAVLLAACPCALCLASPIAVTLAVSKGRQEGILFKDTEAVEAAAQLNTVVMDKTGTITVGKPFVCDIIPFGTSAEEVIMLAASVEEHSAHPMALAVLDCAVKNDILPLEISGYRSSAGFGVSANVAGDTIAVGRPEQVFGDESDGYMSACSELTEVGKSLMGVTKNGVPIGVIAFADKIKPSSYSAVPMLSKMGLRTVMITGDSSPSAKLIADELGMFDYAADVSPDKKAQIVQNLKYGGRKVAMVGDSINDAVALAASDIGIAMGTGSSVAIEGSQIVLVRNDLRDLPIAIKLSKAVVKVIRRNILLSLSFNVLAIPLALGLSFALDVNAFNPVVSIVRVALSLTAISVNSLKIKRIDLTQ